MDAQKYDKLRTKIKTKDFEGNNKNLDKWLFIFSIIGNIGSVFFSYFLVFPGLKKAITINLIEGGWAIFLSLLVTVVFLSSFEIIKRYFIKSFSADYVANEKRFKLKNLSWLAISIAIIVLSFYLSLVGSKNLASTSVVKNEIAKTELGSIEDSVSLKFEEEKEIYLNDNVSLRKINIDLRNKLTETPLNYLTARREYQTSIDKNIEIIEKNRLEIEKIEKKIKERIKEFKNELNSTKAENKDDDLGNIILFLIIAIACEITIIGGVYFREYYENRLYVLNQEKYEFIYQKKDRYRALLTYIYNGGNLKVGELVISGKVLKDIVKEKSKIQNSNKVIEEFLHEMDNLGIFTVIGKRRHIGIKYEDALNIIENYDDTLRIIENMI